ncbi:MAG TPA: beta-galactosidase [bacterium]|nr:beta-galactosidase [bacterium]HPN42600.1 beta-galactosidase [bacterium]
MSVLRKTYITLFLALTLTCACGKKSHDSVSCDNRAFIVDGERILITSAPLPYFHIPAELWADRILKAKRCGINTLVVDVPWYVHEPEEGVYTFTKDQDLDRFLTLCEQAGMYIILRPGPFVRSDTDIIDYPPWLRSKKGRPLASDDAEFIEPLDRFYKNLYPVIQKHLWNKRGNFILLQAENYGNTPQTGSDNLAQHITGWWRSKKLAVPLVGSAPGAPEFRQCLALKRKKNASPLEQKPQPAVPRLNNPLPTRYITWGQNGDNNAGNDLTCRAMKILALGGTEIYYPAFHNGSNFDYHTLFLQTTAGYSPVIGEAGGLNDSYFRLKTIHQFIHTFADFFLNDEPCYTLKYHVNDSLLLSVREQEQTHILFVENSYQLPVTSPLVMDQDTLDTITVPGNSIIPVVINYPLGETGIIDYSTAFVQNIFKGLDGKHYILLSGPAGHTAKIKMTGENKSQEFKITFSPDNTVSSFKFAQFVVLSANDRLAGRVQIMDIKNGQIAVFGPELVRSWKVTGDKIKLEADIAPQCRQAIFYGDGKGGITIPVQSQERRSELPQLKTWTYREETPVWESDYDDSDWLDINDPVSMQLLNNTFAGYGWYRARFDSPVAAIAKLTFTGAADRISVWFNGDRVGNTLNHSGKDPIGFTIKVEKGENVIAVLAENLGLRQPGIQSDPVLIPEEKGLFGPVYIGIRALPVDNWRYKSNLAGEGEEWYVNGKAFKSLKKYSPRKAPLWFATSFKIDNDLFKSIPPLRINMNTLGKGVVWLNGKMLGRHWNIGPDDRLYIPESWLERKNTLVIFDEEGFSPERVRLLWDQENNLNPASITYSFK